MSNWTHVAAIVRLDCIRPLYDRDPNMDDLFGKECLWDAPGEVRSDAEKHPENYLPTGSEGSLHKSVWINPNRQEIPAFVISIFGDLRDHDSSQEIIEWFKKKCEKAMEFHCFIRNAVITAENECNGSAHWEYEE